MTANSGKELLQNMLTKAINSEGNWTKHVNHACCKCSKCTCGKHKCQIKSPHLGLSPSNSTYNNSYNKKKPISQSRVKTQHSYESYEPRIIVQKTQYKQQYTDKIKDTTKVKYQIHHDNIQTGGPTFNTTTYQRNYQTISTAPVSKIINPQNLQCTPGVKLNANSSYRDNYKWHLKQQIKKQKPVKRPDNLKLDISLFTSQSRYTMDYHKFNGFKRQKSFAPDRSYQQTKGLKTQTSYHDHFSYKQPNRCPAEGQI